MNAGAEYVAYRIWATLQEEHGIHPASLLTCLGALAGYACQASVRKTSARSRADANLPLIESPLSVWALVSRIVQKLGKPLPDLNEILAHTNAAGAGDFSAPQWGAEHRPRHPAIFYLTQIWPQILPIAQRFCSRPMQIPVLFGIALQRTIEQIQDEVSPTLSASIAMESAIAMSKVVLPAIDNSDILNANTGASIDAPGLLPVNAAASLTMSAGSRLSASTGGIASGTSGTSGTSGANSAATEPMYARAKPSRRSRAVADTDSGTPALGALLARFPPAARIVTIMSLAFITVAGAMHSGDQTGGPGTARLERPLEIRKFGEGMPAPLPEPSMQLAQASPQPQVEEQPETPVAAAAEPVAEALPPDEVPTPYESVQPAPENSAPEGYDEMVIRE